MATITTSTVDISYPRERYVYTSDLAAAADVVSLDAINPEGYRQGCVTVLMYSDSAGTTPTVPAAGTFAVTGKPLGCDAFQTAAATIDATAPSPRTWTFPVVGVKLTPTSLTAGTYWRIVVTFLKD